MPIVRKPGKAGMHASRCDQNFSNKVTPFEVFLPDYAQNEIVEINPIWNSRDVLVRQAQ